MYYEKSYSLLQLTNQTVGSLGLVRQVCLGFFNSFFIGQTIILFLIHNKSKFDSSSLSNNVPKNNAEHIEKKYWINLNSVWY